MESKKTCLLCAAVLLILSSLCLFLPKETFSESERRLLAAFPEVSAESIFSGNFSGSFEEYATDTFPFREFFRSVKAYSSKYLFGLADNNGVFLQNGHLSKVEYPLSEPMLSHAAERFDFINNTYLKDKTSKIYLSIIPDKSYFLKTLKLDYDKLVTYMHEKMPYAEYIDIFPNLFLDDYYTTDSHWRQDRIGDVANTIADAMGADISSGYTLSIFRPFYGVYYGQSALKVAPDTIKYITSNLLNDCIVTSYDSGKAEPSLMYDIEKARGRDAYEMFLSGGDALLTIENPRAETERELIIFRDSFASSLTPHLVPGYSKITLIDIRYINSALLGNFVDFENADVLFLYSTSLLNSSLGMK